MFLAQPANVSITCGIIDQLIEFPCQCNLSVIDRVINRWIINLQLFNNYNLPYGHKYIDQVLTVTSVKSTQNNTRYQCVISTIVGHTPCIYRSAIGSLIINCKGNYWYIQFCLEYFWPTGKKKSMFSLVL